MKSDRKSHRPADKDADLGDALRQLETLLDSKTSSDDPDPAADNLPVLDDIVDPEEYSHEMNDAITGLTSVLTADEATRPDPRQIRDLIDGLAEQMEVELETVVGMLKHSVLHEFKSELATALNLDPQQLDSQKNNLNDDSTLR